MQHSTLLLTRADLLMEGFAAAGQKTPALDRAPGLPSESVKRAKGFCEQLDLIERIN